MANPFFQFKEFTVWHDKCAMKVTTDACLFGAWCARYLAGSEASHALDIGTGTGLLSLMIAQQADLSIDAVEIDPDAAVQAAENRTAAGFAGINILQGDITRLDLPRYPVIFSNPPFYEQEIVSGNALKRVAHHGDGLSWEALFSFIGTQLTEDGTAYLLLPYKRRGELPALLGKVGLHMQTVVTVFPRPGAEPSRLMLRLSKEAGEVQAEEMTIADGAGYTARFVSLLQPYYLYL